MRFLAKFQKKMASGKKSDETWGLLVGLHYLCGQNDICLKTKI